MFIVCSFIEKYINGKRQGHFYVSLHVREMISKESMAYFQSVRMRYEARELYNYWLQGLLLLYSYKVRMGIKQNVFGSHAEN